MVRDVLRSTNLEHSTFMLEPKDLVGDNDKSAVIKSIFRSAKAVKESLRIVWLEEIEFIAGVKDKS